MALLDFVDSNPVSRIPRSVYRSLEGVKQRLAASKRLMAAIPPGNTLIDREDFVDVAEDEKAVGEPRNGVEDERKDNPAFNIASLAEAQQPQQAVPPSAEQSNKSTLSKDQQPPSVSVPHSV